MGSCLSDYSVEIEDMLDTAKVITIDGSLRVYSIRTKVSEILNENKNSTASFLCSSDELDLDRDVHALSSHDQVEIGQIYFILPQSMLNRPLKGQDMAALAVKASLALPGALEKKTPYTTGSGFKKSEQIWNALSRNTGTNLGGRTSMRGQHNKSRLAAIRE
jgi:PADRE domain